MLIAAIIIAVLALALGLLGVFAAGMSDVPGATSPVSGTALFLLVVAGVLFGLWLAGFHFVPLITRG